MKEKIVAKFGGTSMKDHQAMLRSAQIALKNQAFLVVVSATSGTTNQLIELANKALAGEWKTCSDLLSQIKARHSEIAKKLNSHDSVYLCLDELISELETLVKGVYLIKDLTPKAYDNILSIGERLSSKLIVEAFKQMTDTKKIVFKDARNLLKTDGQFNKAMPLLTQTKEACAKEIPFHDDTIYITQGFIGSNEEGHTTTLGRGGSDYSASLLAEASGADVLQIWTDVAGMATTDPRICSDAKAITELSYMEASEMAQYGAKILHPTTIVPAMRAKMKVFVGSSYNDKAKGTWIKETCQHTPALRAIAKRDNQSLLIVRTPKMLNAYGFLERIFEVFRQHKISVDCVTTSEISIAVSVDRATCEHKAMLADLAKLGEVSIENDLALVSIIGNRIHHTMGIGHKIFTALNGINVRMICLGASEHNFCLLVAASEVDEAIRKLHTFFIEGMQENEVSTAW